ncbi:glycerol kinase [Aureimonas endophytica]|uniref:Glycerol kinase n=1 Tax=Aureimonas endophytica TaxID=2027858 RepID=A0A916ZSC0_9HYPH|nr:FGGY family carbohydrate kinase [Aureimonas endophytica]GGE10531.1 glycerol kinase [Aureimonas endophytica]
MAAADLLLAIDQGTSSTKCLLIDRAGTVVAEGAAPLGETCPQPGHVEQDPEEIWQSLKTAVARTFERADAARVAAVGLSTQRESILLWDKATGKALSPLLSWQDQRTVELARRIGTGEARRTVRRLSGLPLDPMFSALKAAWLLDRFDPERRRAEAGEIALGTVDSWLLWKLGGEHVTEIGNASRTQLLDTARAEWSPELCDLFRVPMAALPRLLPSVGPFPAVRGLAPLRDGTPVTAVLGDSHAALFGHGAFRPGSVKATFGTGSSVMGLVGEAAGAMDPGTCLTIGWQIEPGRPAFAAEGNIRSAGSTLRWLAAIFDRPVAELVAEALEAPAAGIHLVPAFNGLGAPYWDDGATAILSGFKLGTSRGAIMRAGLESIAHQVADVVASVERTTGRRIERLFADGGPSGNDDLMRMQADFADLTVLRAPVAGLSAIGAAHLAGLSAGLWSLADLEALPRRRDIFEPRSSADERAAARAAWAGAVARARGEAGTPSGLRPDAAPAPALAG